jgi:hypothetical protein
MRLLFVGNADNPLLVDLALELKRLRPGLVVDILSERASRHPRAGEAFDSIRFPEGGGWFGGTRGVKFFWFLLHYRALLKAVPDGYDVVHVFYLSAIWGALADALAAKGHRMIVSLFGSDVYRTNGILKPLQARLLKRADRITSANQDTLEAARGQYGVEPARGVIVRFGLRPLEHIDRLRAIGDRIAHKRAMGIPEERIVLAAGYNASPHQHHQAIIDSLCIIPKDRRGRLFVLVPMTMGGSSDQVARVRGMLAASGFDHRIITELMTDEEVARLRLATDIMVQVQPTDQLAGAMQEHLYAGSVVITGAWLPYRVLSDAGVRFWTIADRSGLAKELEMCMSELSDREAACAGNDAPIRALSSWSHTAPRWSALYD